jgi:ribonuclease HI
MENTPATDPIIYYTDGSCEPNPGDGGFAVIRDMKPHILGSEKDSTNIRMEGWKKKGGEIKNLDIVREVCPLYRDSTATLVWVRGHNNDPGNELADHWANEARKGTKL